MCDISKEERSLLFKIFLSSNSSNVGLSDSLLMSFAPIMERSNLRSSSETVCKIFLSINSDRVGLCAILMAKVSLRASLAARRSEKNHQIFITLLPMRKTRVQKANKNIFDSLPSSSIFSST